MRQIQLGTPEKPVRVNYDETTKYRWLFVKVDYTQHTLIEALEKQEAERLHTDIHIRQGTNLGYGECKLRFPSRARRLAGCYVTLGVRPGAFRHRRGRSTLGLYATEVKVVNRPWRSWRL